MFHTPSVTPFAIALVVCKTFLFDHLFNEDGDRLMELLKGNKLYQVMDKFTPFC